MSRAVRCPQCAGGFLKANGKCGKCNGTGINTQISSDEPKCPACGGTGVCSNCGGSGRVEWNSYPG